MEEFEREDESKTSRRNHLQKERERHVNRPYKECLIPQARIDATNAQLRVLHRDIGEVDKENRAKIKTALEGKNIAWVVSHNEMRSPWLGKVHAFLGHRDLRFDYANREASIQIIDFEEILPNKLVIFYDTYYRDHLPTPFPPWVHEPDKNKIYLLQWKDDKSELTITLIEPVELERHRAEAHKPLLKQVRAEERRRVSAT